MNEPTAVDNKKKRAYKEEIAERLQTLKNRQTAVQEQLEKGGDFISLLDEDALPEDESVAGFIIKHCDLLDNYELAQALNRLFYSPEADDDGKAVKWFRRRLGDLTFEETTSTLWCEESNVDAFLLVARYLRLTDENKVAAQSLARVIAKEKKSSIAPSEDVYDFAVEQLFQSLNSDPFWNAHKD